MYFGNSVLVITNNEKMIPLISSELVQLRNIDSVMVRNSKDTLSALTTENPQVIIINCQNEIEESVCDELIRKIKKETEAPILVILENYNSKFVNKLYKLGVDDVLDIENATNEILMRTIWALKNNEQKRKMSRYENILTQMEIINQKTGFYSSKSCALVFKNELENLNNNKQNSVFMVVAPNENSRLKPSTKFLIESIKKNLREADVVAHTKKADTFYVLLENTNLSGAIVIWNRLNTAIGTEEALCGCICDTDGKDYEEIENSVKEGLNNSKNSQNCLYVVEVETNDESNWLDTMDIPNTNSKNFKLFEQVFHKKYQKIIKPAVENVVNDYGEILATVEINKEIQKDYLKYTFTHPRQESYFQITYIGGSHIKIDCVHEGLDSPENKSYKIELKEVTEKEIQDDLETFLIEYKSCL